MNKIVIITLMCTMLCQANAQISEIKDWIFLSYETADMYKVTLGDTEKRSGKKALEVQVKGKGIGRLVNKIQNVSESKKYTLTLFYKTNDDFSGYFLVDAAGRRTTCEKFTTGWRKVELRDIVPRNNMIYLAVWFSQAKGTVYLDDFSLVEQD